MKHLLQLHLCTSVLLLMNSCHLWKGLWSSLCHRTMGATPSPLPASAEKEMRGRAALLMFLSGVGCRRLESAHGRAIRRPDTSLTVFALSLDFEYFPQDKNSGFGTSSKLKRLDWFEFQTELNFITWESILCRNNNLPG